MIGEQVLQAPGRLRLEHPDVVAAPHQLAQHAAQEVGVAVVPARLQRMGEIDDLHAGWPAKAAKAGDNGRDKRAACASAIAADGVVLRAGQRPRHRDLPLRLRSPAKLRRSAASSSGSRGSKNQAASPQSSRKRGNVGQHERAAGLRRLKHREAERLVERAGGEYWPQRQPDCDLGDGRGPSWMHMREAHALAMRPVQAAPRQPRGALP